MSRLLTQLLKHGAVTIQDGRIVPTHDRAARSREIFDAEAKERQRVHGNTAPGKKSLVANVPPVNSLKSRDAAGRAFGVVYSDHQLLLADAGGVTVFTATKQGERSA